MDRLSQYSGGAASNPAQRPWRQHTGWHACVTVVLLALVMLGIAAAVLQCQVADGCATSWQPSSSGVLHVTQCDVQLTTSDVPVPTVPFQHLCHHAFCHVAPPLPVMMVVVLVEFVVFVVRTTLLQRSIALPPTAPPPQVVFR